jgi:hypothetical protein
VQRCSVGTGRAVDVDPRRGRTEPGAPEHRGHGHVAAVREPYGAAFTGHDAVRQQPHATRAGEVAQLRADDRVPTSPHVPGHPALALRVQHAGQVGPPVQVDGEPGHRQVPGLTGSGHRDAVRAGELDGQLGGGAAASDDEHVAGRDVRRRAVVVGVQLVDVGGQVGGGRRHERRAEGPGRDHDVLSAYRSGGGLRHERTVVAAQPAHVDARAHRQVEPVDVAAEVVRHLRAGRAAGRAVGEGQAGQAAEPSGREQHEAVPAVSPALPDGRPVEDEHAAPRAAPQPVRRTEPRLARADDEHVDARRERFSHAAATRRGPRAGHPCST